MACSNPFYHVTLGFRLCSYLCRCEVYAGEMKIFQDVFNVFVCIFDTFLGHPRQLKKNENVPMAKPHQNTYAFLLKLFKSMGQKCTCMRQ